ncbi:hypothetical protein [Roseibacillus persicicus]|uniref:Uncharacterized protein n=1 Tax=Roseibacillus persicicus TaxID=454148 RepID=A0A918TCV5_9BACT|nr:hypothetical protein [Roseibacillus persicicus]GHC43710.1 hypothetical protein GCM10007100_06110 [Roseibacillus persicicus]
MKHTLLALCSLTLATSSLAQNAEDFDPLGEHLNLPKQIRVMVEYIEVPLPELTKLLAEPRKSANDGDLRETVGKLVEAGTAKHQETQFIIARSGETATTEGILEYIYPKEYEPSEVPNEISSNQDTGQAMEIAKMVATPPTPTAFETRNTGSTLEIQPTIGADDKTIDLRLAPELVEHIRNEIWSEWNGVHGKAPIQMPLFSSARINTGLTLINGQYCLAGTTSMKGEDGKPDHQRKLLFSVRADILTAGL